MNLDRALDGFDDLDLLVNRKDSCAFEAIISSLKFKEAASRDSSHPSISHHYGYNEETGAIVHLHVYYEIITGGSVFKNYHLPLDQMLLQETRYVGVVRVPSKAAELVLFVIRKMLEHTNIVDMLLFYQKEYRAVERELEWLSDDQTQVEVVRLLKHWLPVLDPRVLLEALKELRSKGSILRRIFLASRINRCLRQYSLHSALRSMFIRSYRAVSRVILRILNRKNKRTFVTGGSVIGIVGPEATGKSTICAAIGDWLSNDFCVETIHAGKPHSTWLTFLPNLAVPVLRRLFPSHRSNKIKGDLFKSNKRTEVRGLRFLVFALRSIMLAFDRSVLLCKVFRKASSGSVMICDRYPSHRIGAMDSPQMDAPEHKAARPSLRDSLAKLEKRIYKRIPPPDIVIKLTVPIEIALERNTLRNKKCGLEDEDFVKVRHLQSHEQEYPTVDAHAVDTNKPLSETILEVERTIWGYL